MIDISMVVPVFNEAETLINVCQGVRRELTQIGITWELIFINDGSTDSTPLILEQLAEEDQRVRVIHFKRNLGQTAAMMAGFDHARGEVIIPLDGDGQNDPADIPKMLEVLDQAPSGSGAEISGLETMVTNLVIAESQHEAIEEQFLWPAVRDALEDGDALADDAISAGK